MSLIWHHTTVGPTIIVAVCDEIYDLVKFVRITTDGAEYALKECFLFFSNIEFL